jgi:hypothetical protein
VSIFICLLRQVHRCPNRDACTGNRTLIAACQQELSCPRGAQYKALQCSKGYRGNVCGSCRKDEGYGMSRYFRCSECMSVGGSVAAILVMLIGALLLGSLRGGLSWRC